MCEGVVLAFIWAVWVYVYAAFPLLKFAGKLRAPEKMDFILGGAYRGWEEIKVGALVFETMGMEADQSQATFHHIQ